MESKTQKGYRPHTQAKSKTADGQSLLFWLAIAGLAAFVATQSFRTALFNGGAWTYEAPINTAVIWAALLLLIVSIRVFPAWRFTDSRDLMTAAVWVIPLFYLISLTQAASSHFAGQMALISTLYAAFFVAGNVLAREKPGAAFIQQAIVVTGYIVVVYGFVNMFGNDYFHHAVMIEYNGLRLTSVFQYANAYVAYLMALLVACLFLTVSARKWYWIALHASMLIPIMASFWLTQSRGGYVLLPLILVLVLPFLSVVRQIMMCVYLGGAALLSITLTERFVDIAKPLREKFVAFYEQTGKKPSDLLSVFDAASWSGWSRLLLYSLAFAAAAALIQAFVYPLLEKKLQKVSGFKYSGVLFPLGLIVLGAAGVYVLLGTTWVTSLLPDMLRTRIENINFQQHSVLERGTFYEDAWKVIRDYPLLGSGGGGWMALWEKYQNNPYISRQAHSFIFQYAIDVGLIGAALFLLLLGTIYYRYVRSCIKKGESDRTSHLIFYIVSIALLIHSMIDFEMSYVYIAALLFLCLGGVTAGTAPHRYGWTRRIGDSRWRMAVPAAVCAIAVAVFIVGAVKLRADQHYRNALTAINEQKTFEQMLAPLDAALSLQPNNPAYVLTKANLMDQAYQQLKDESYYEASFSLIDGLEAKEPYNRSVLEKRYSQYIVKQNYDAALGQIKHMLALFPWDTPDEEKNPRIPSFYERGIDLYVFLADKAGKENNAELKNRYESDALNLLQTVMTKTEQLAALPKGQMQGRAFGVTPQMRLTIGQTHYRNGKYKEAADLLGPAVKEDLSKPADRYIVRFYLASLQKLNQNDQKLYDRLVAVDANEKALLEQLKAAN
ncbi:O-antigen ligase family protein [Paenibacillus sp. MBLB4367]|uniref:O-antigen ligase family protein n=1 Tax=Paenibacillus sp. MBLB4367 TaxID=3384767 RepID=UPI0039081A96